MSEDPNFSSRAQQLGRQLCIFRENKRLKINEMAGLLNISAKRYKSYESGAQSPSLPEMEILSIKLGVPITALLAQDEPQPDMMSMDATSTMNFIQLRQRIIATRLKMILEEAEIPRIDLANALHIKLNELSSYLNGKKSIPIPMLEVLCRIAAIAVQTLIGTQGAMGEKLSLAERAAGFKRLPADLQDFIAQPINRPYVDLAYRMSNLPVDKLRSIAEGLLDITLY